MGTFLSFKDISRKIKKITQKNDTFIFWILLVLSIDYLALFFVESILPGYVISSLNLNLLLVFLLLGWVFYSFYSKPEKPLVKNPISLSAGGFGIALLAIFVLGGSFTLYRISNLELGIMFLFLGLIGFLFFKEFNKFE